MLFVGTNGASKFSHCLVDNEVDCLIHFSVCLCAFCSFPWVFLLKTSLAGGNISLHSLDPELLPELCVTNWCGQKEGKREENEVVVFVPKKEKDRDKLF